MGKNFTKSYLKATELQKTSAIAVPGNDKDFGIVNVPRSFIGKRCWVLTQEAYESLKNRH
jgi:hypothetical protein